MNPAFTVKLEQQILPGLIVTGKCKDPCIQPVHHPALLSLQLFPCS
jgi:hypothetical protein